jgi:hypothetical protein
VRHALGCCTGCAGMEYGADAEDADPSATSEVDTGNGLAPAAGPCRDAAPCDPADTVPGTAEGDVRADVAVPDDDPRAGTAAPIDDDPRAALPISRSTSSLGAAGRDRGLNIKTSKHQK